MVTDFEPMQMKAAEQAGTQNFLKSNPTSSEVLLVLIFMGSEPAMICAEPWPLVTADFPVALSSFFAKLFSPFALQSR